MSEKGDVVANLLDRFVLDSFALLAYLEDEAGAAETERILRAAQMGDASLWLSVVNLGEVVYITEREQSLEAAHTVLAVVDQLPISIVDADRSATLDAAHIKANNAVSYADSFAIALAKSMDAAVVTGDPEFRKVEKTVRVHWLARP
jgi:predicted nucleic acid-binding protein